MFLNFRKKEQQDLFPFSILVSNFLYDIERHYSNEVTLWPLRSLRVATFALQVVKPIPSCYKWRSLTLWSEIFYKQDFFICWWE